LLRPSFLEGTLMNTLRLKKKEDRRIRRGHPWVFSNELEPGISGISPGELVLLEEHSGKPLGVGYANPHSLIAVRLIGRAGEEVGPALFRERILNARTLRERFCPGRDVYRAVYSESDFLPGLIVDRYSRWLSVQVLTAGMERMLPFVMDALEEVYRPDGIVLRNDSVQRTHEGLSLEKKVAKGECAGPVDIDINGTRLKVDLLEGQKTGFFLDQVDNYGLLDKIAEGADMLDLFCYIGAWALAGLKAGAKSALCVDSSGPALSAAEENFRLNGFEGRSEFVRDDAFSALKKIIDSGRRFGVVVADPPAFVKSRAKLAEGLKGYRDLNVKAMRTVSPGGFLISCSCSHHVDRETFREMLMAGAAGSGRAVRLIEMRTQSKDHPVLLAAPETEYLKCALLQVM